MNAFKASTRGFTRLCECLTLTMTFYSAAFRTHTFSTEKNLEIYMRKAETLETIFALHQLI